MFPIYPYHNIEDFNLDWIIKLIKKLEKEIDTFTALTKITWAGEWDITKYYTQWSLVDDNGNGYISIKPVPRNVPITDSNYWVLVADYSALYAAFSQRITDLENAVDTINNTTIPNVQSDIDNINNVELPNIQGEIDNINNVELPNMQSLINEQFNATSKILVLADSYGLATVGPEQAHGYTWHMQQLIDNDIYILAEGGMGYNHPGTLGHYPNDLLTNWTGDKDSITDVVCTLGLNDTGSATYPYTDANFTNAVISTINLIKTDYSNARIHLGVAGWDFAMSDQALINFREIVCTVNQLANYYGCQQICNVEYVMHLSSWLQSDLCHPNNSGARRLAYHIINHLKGFETNVRYVIKESITLGGIQHYATVQMSNEITTIRLPNYVNMTAQAMDGSSKIIGAINNQHFAYLDVPSLYSMAYNVPIKLIIEHSNVRAQSDSTGSLTTLYNCVLISDSINV